MKKNKWTRFMDMSSGGGRKEGSYKYIYIEAPEEEAKVIFYNRFGHSPDRVSCTCCGQDYSIGEAETLREATGFERGCRFGYVNKEGQEVPEQQARVRGKGLVNGCKDTYFEEKGTNPVSRDYIPLNEYLKQENILVVYKNDIKKTERLGEVPDQGYVWVD